MDSRHNLARLIDLHNLIGEDLLLDILKRLPVQTLCRFRCVCKSWKYLLSSPFFINLHHSFTSSTTPVNLKPYLRLNVGRRRCHESYALCRPQETRVEHLTHDLRFPFRVWEDMKPSTSFTCVDVIHGVVCVSHTKASSFDSTVLWNPTIHKYVALPCLPFPSHLESTIADLADQNPPDRNYLSRSARFFSHAIGFGYDSSIKDFKVVRIWTPCYCTKDYYTPLPLTYEVYSAGEGLWRLATADINIKSYKFDDSRRTGCFVNGTIHWLGSRFATTPYFHRQHCVVLFDCGREEFRTMELPKEIYMEEPRVVELSECAGMLSALLHLRRPDEIEVWGMEEHGVATTWKKMFRIPCCNELSLGDIKMYQPSLVKLPPYGPNKWIHFRWIDDKYKYEILRGHVYEESLFLMDDTKAQSYPKEGIVLFYFANLSYHFA